MKKIYLSMLAALGLGAAMQAQTACNNGRYSTDVYSTYSVTSNITYGKNVTFSGTTQTLTLDFYEPTADTAHYRPLIIWAHGGSFISGKPPSTISSAPIRCGYSAAATAPTKPPMEWPSNRSARAICR